MTENEKLSFKTVSTDTVNKTLILTGWVSLLVLFICGFKLGQISGRKTR
jgi:hypothetical protein